MAATGADALAQLLVFERNMFDRLVHFLFGLFMVLPLIEMGLRHAAMTLRMACIFTGLFVLAFGGLYEIFEWALTLSLSPEGAGAYNGEQGDIYDAQKDMAIAALGAALALPLAAGMLRRRSCRLRCKLNA
jgi:putative membrane protein